MPPSFIFFLFSTSSPLPFPWVLPSGANTTRRFYTENVSRLHPARTPQTWLLVYEYTTAL